MGRRSTEGFLFAGQFAEFAGVGEEPIGELLGEGLFGAEPPGDSCGRDCRPFGCFDVANLVPDINHIEGGERVGSGDGTQVFPLSPELAAGRDEVEVLSHPVLVEKDLDVFGGIGGENSQGNGLVVQLRDLFGDPRIGLQFGNLFPEHDASAIEDVREVPWLEPNAFQEFADTELAKGGEVVRAEFDEVEFRSEFVVDFTSGLQSVGEGSVEVEDDH